LLFFLVCFSWIAFAFWTAVLGFVQVLSARPVEGLRGPASWSDASRISSRVALVVPVRDEDPHAVFAALRAMGESIGRSGHGHALDFFVLSDTVDPDILVAEEVAWAEVRGHLAGRCSVYYRRRDDNSGKKAGNLTEFCRRWGAAYDYFIVLDADSLMETTTIVTMTRIMELNPHVGILQAPPVAVGGVTRFARLQQFAGYAYGRVVTAGLAAWQGGESNYWGHNAIIRTTAFARACGLPVLSGRGPFSGEILSHDFVEAALMRRAGLEVWMLPALSGSYERLPPTLLDYARRDRRWCAGNLQHVRLLTTAGLHPVSRLHLLVGAVSYLVSPAWLLLILSGVLAAGIDSARGTVGADPAASLAVFGCSALLVFLPRILGIVVVLRDRDARAGLGGVRGVVTSGAYEVVVSALSAPVMMVMQTVSLIGILLGRRVSWGSQRRDGGDLPIGAGLRVHWPHLLLGVVLACVIAVVPGSFPWLIAITASLLLAPWLTSWTSRADPEGSLLRRVARTPDEIAPPALLARATALEAGSSLTVSDGLERVLTDGRSFAVHLAILSTASPPREPVPERVERLVRARQWRSIGRAERATALRSATFLSAARESLADERADERALRRERDEAP
jgi:membrane glycosyltransferase